MKKLLIIGVGGLGREVLSWAEAIPRHERDWEVAGFLDDNPNAPKTLNNLRVLGGVQDYRTSADEYLAFGIGSPKIKLELASMLLERGARFATIIHPSVVMGNNVRIGQGCMIGPNSLLTCDCELSDFVTITGMSNISHDVKVGAGSTICGHVGVSGEVAIGKGVFVGSHACLLPRSRVGDFATVGAGSVVLKVVKSETTVFGNPAKKI